MKSNMHRVDYDGKPNIEGKLWVWTETCDKCGNIIQDENVLRSCPHGESEADFCVGCLRYLMDNKIPYEQARSLYVNR